MLVFSFVLAACTGTFGGGTAQPEDTPSAVSTAVAVTLTYWEEEADDGDVLLDGLAVEFMKANPPIKVERVHHSYEELQSRLKGGDTPDLVRCISDCTGPFSQSGQFRPLDGLFDRVFLDGFFPGALVAATVGGQLWGIPDNYGNALMLIYNRNLVSEVPSDTDAWIAQLKGLTDPASDRYGLAYFLDEPYWLLPWLGGFGGWPLDSADKLTLDSRTMVDALEFVQSLKVVDRVVLPQADYDMAFDYFRQGRAAYLIDGEWSLDALRQTGLPFGVTALPKISATGLDPTPATSGRHWFLASHVQGSKLDAARSFITFMTSAHTQERWLEKARRLPSRREVAANSPIIAADPILKGLMDQFSKGRGLPQAPVMRCVWSAMRPSLQAVMADQLAPATAARTMQTDAVACADDYRPPPSGCRHGDEGQRSECHLRGTSAAQGCLYCTTVAVESCLTNGTGGSRMALASGSRHPLSSASINGMDAGITHSISGGHSSKSTRRSITSPPTGDRLVRPDSGQTRGSVVLPLDLTLAKGGDVLGPSCLCHLPS